MSEFKGTPGPWEVDEIGDVMSDEYCVAAVACGDIEDGGEPSKAMMDAILIAAAPELLEALQRLKTEIILSDVDMDYIESHFRPHLDKAASAIDKALGQ